MNAEDTIFNHILMIFSKVGVFFTIIPIVVAILVRKEMNRKLKFFYFFLLITLTFNLVEQGFIWVANNYTSFILPYLKIFEIGDTNFLNIFFKLTDYIGLGLFFGKILEKNVGYWVKRISFGLAILAVGVYFFIDGFNQYGVVNPLINRIYLIIIPLLYIKQIYQSEPAINLWKNSYFLISIGVLVPALFGMLMSFTGNKLHETDYPLFVKLALARNFLLVLAQFVFAYAFSQSRYLKFLERN